MLPEDIHKLPPHGRSFGLKPPVIPLEFPIIIKLHSFPYKFWLLRSPTSLPLGISMG